MSVFVRRAIQKFCGSCRMQSNVSCASLLEKHQQQYPCPCDSSDTVDRFWRFDAISQNPRVVLFMTDLTREEKALAVALDHSLLNPLGCDHDPMIVAVSVGSLLEFTDDVLLHLHLDRLVHGELIDGSGVI